MLIAIGLKYLHCRLNVGVWLLDFIYERFNIGLARATASTCAQVFRDRQHIVLPALNCKLNFGLCYALANANIHNESVNEIDYILQNEFYIK